MGGLPVGRLKFVLEGVKELKERVGSDSEAQARGRAPLHNPS